MGTKRPIINSIAFDDLGHWAVVGMATRFEASDNAIRTWQEEGETQYGALRCVHMTNDAMVAVYSNGYKFSGNVPQKDAVYNTQRIKHQQNKQY